MLPIRANKSRGDRHGTAAICGLARCRLCPRLTPRGGLSARVSQPIQFRSLCPVFPGDQPRQGRLCLCGVVDRGAISPISPYSGCMPVATRQRRSEGVITRNTEAPGLCSASHHNLKSPGERGLVDLRSTSLVLYPGRTGKRGKEKPASRWGRKAAG